MDQYTKMCSKLKELQGEWEPTKGDWVYSVVDFDVICIADIQIPAIKKFIKDFIWFPTLEQLVGMMPKGYIKICSPTIHGTYWTVDFTMGANTWNSFTHTELKIVMLQALAWARWGKKWDKEKGEWIKP